MLKLKIFIKNKRNYKKKKQNWTSTRFKRHFCCNARQSTAARPRQRTLGLFFLSRVTFFLAYVFFSSFFLRLTNSTLLQARSVIHDIRD